MNWWLATLEHFGLLTNEEAEFIADEVKSSIHKEGYKEAHEELEAILTKIKHPTSPVIVQLQSEIAELRSELYELKNTADKKPIAQPKKV